MLADKDLLSMQQARILAENALQAQKRLAGFSQERLDAIVEGMAAAVLPRAAELAGLSCEETGYGNRADKELKNRFACQRIHNALRGLRCVGALHRDEQAGVLSIGVPVGVIAALCPVTSPVSTTIYKALLAVKTANAIIFSPHPGAGRSIRAALDIMREAALANGLPEGCLSCLSAVSKSGSRELMEHPAVSLLLLTGVPGMYGAARASGKPLIYGGAGCGPAFIERSTDIPAAARDIIRSKSFDNGIAPASELAVVVEAGAVGAAQEAFSGHGAYFMREEEAETIAALFFHADGRRRTSSTGLDARALARRAGFAVPENTLLLLADRKHVALSDPFSRGIPAPVLGWYVEEDWEHACEKCIELLLLERNAHTMTIHSGNEDIIRQFALKKPVARLLVNTPAVFGGIGATTNLFPALTLGSGTAGYGITADNVSPLNLVHIRKVGRGVRSADGDSCFVEANGTRMWAPPAPARGSAPGTRQDLPALDPANQGRQRPASAMPHAQAKETGREEGVRVLRKLLQETLKGLSPKDG